MSRETDSIQHMRQYLCDVVHVGQVVMN